MISTVLTLIIAGAAGAALGLFFPASKQGLSFANDEKRLEEAKEQAQKLKQETHEKIKEMEHEFKEEEATAQESLESMEKLIAQKEELLNKRETRNKQSQDQLQELEKEIKLLKAQQEELRQSAIEKLSASSGIKREKALENSKKEIELLVTENKEKRLAADFEEFQDDIARHAKAALQVVIQRLGVPSSVDRNNTNVQVKDDRFKGLLIGKDGVNVKYLEELLPVSIIFNLNAPDVIHVGGVNLLRRNIAKRAINKLQKQVRKTKKIDHEMIKGAVEASEKEVMDECDRHGKWAFKQMGLNPDEAHPEIVNYVGRLYFRTSYGQNIIHHSLEMAYAARLLAELIGSDQEIAMLAAFYHDLGKAIDHDVGGAHDDLSKEILEKHDFDPRIVHAAYAHHDKVPCEAPADFLVKAVDAISGGRPGARMESVTNYFERMKQLEDIAQSFPGTNKVQTMSAGREVRVEVNRESIDDKHMQELAEEVAEKISEEVAFPGIIKVNLIRRTKSVDYARDKTRQ